MRLALLFSAAALLAACGGSTGAGGSNDGGAQDGGPAQDGEPAEAAAPTDAGQGQGDAGGGACNTLANVAAVISVQQVAQPPPQPQGGTIADGTYAMTDFTIYTGAGGPSGSTGSAQTTIQIAGGTVQSVSNGNPTRRTVTLVTSGSSFTGTDTCPDTTVVQGSYTATATTFLVFLDGGTDDAGARTIVETFTKQ